MSYSFSARGATREALKTAIAEKMADVVKNQPLHKKDAPAVLAAADQFVGMVRDAKPTEDYLANIHGSLSWNGSLEQGKEELIAINSANVGISISHAEKPRDETVG